MICIRKIQLSYRSKFPEYLGFEIHEHYHEIDCCIEGCRINTEIRVYVPIP